LAIARRYDRSQVLKVGTHKMKLSNRAKSALATAGYSMDESSAIAQLAAFAAQNSGIDWANYYTHGDKRPGAWREGRRAYTQECRSITADWKRFKDALIQAALAGVTDEIVIAEAPHAFSGRLEWVSKDYLRQKHGLNADYSPRWDYCTGQYFPTEYRKAAATVLENATRTAKRNRPPEQRTVTSIAELRALNEANGGCWFGKSEMRFFGTRIESGILPGNRFVTSEQPPHGSRKFSVRSFDAQGDIDTVGDFCAYSNRADALLAARNFNVDNAITNAA
jgi:hypothetical protein